MDNKFSSELGLVLGSYCGDSCPTDSLENALRKRTKQNRVGKQTR
jgi:hypothetical protein